MIEQYERRGQTAQEFVALSFAMYNSSEKLERVLESDHTSVLEEGLKFYPELRYWADHYVAAGTTDFSKDFSKAWTKLMNADRFNGPLGNVCDA